MPIPVLPHCAVTPGLGFECTDTLSFCRISSSPGTLSHHQRLHDWVLRQDIRGEEQVEGRLGTHLPLSSPCRVSPVHRFMDIHVASIHRARGSSLTTESLMSFAIMTSGPRRSSPATRRTFTASVWVQLIHTSSRRFKKPFVACALARYVASSSPSNWGTLSRTTIRRCHSMSPSRARSAARGVWISSCATKD